MSRDGRKVGTITPGQTTFVANQQTRTDASVLSEPLRDIFVSMQQADETGITVNVKVNPLIWFSWGGFILLLIGTSLATWPKKGGAVAPVPATREARTVQGEFR